ncbi:MAG TPA: DUF1569 domain-containing protein [Pyrinomonadaceae bacterium]|nr:DUF1569 domain-containing protein [Pyrinomonadaceae bacterium]
MFDTTTHAEIIDRIHRLRPDAERRWGQMTSSQMVAHLSDQMRHTLSEATAPAFQVICETHLVDRFVALGPAGEWPEHPMFGRMTGKYWGFFCHKHFNHHLSQFGVWALHVR